VRDFVVDRAITGGHDWERTPAFATLASVSGYVQFNLRGREAKGMLDEKSETFGRYVRWLREAFQSFRIADTASRWSSRSPSRATRFPARANRTCPTSSSRGRGAHGIEDSLAGSRDHRRRAANRPQRQSPSGGFSIVVEPRVRAASSTRPATSSM
jgi:hypothetical protein